MRGRKREGGKSAREGGAGGRAIKALSFLFFRGFETIVKRWEEEEQIFYCIIELIS